jgi:chromosome segregation ATPase
MMDNEKELVWLPKEIADEVQKLQDPFSEECRALIAKYIDEARRDYQNDLQALDEDVLMYRGLLVKAKKSFEAAKNEQLSAHYDVWEKFDKDLPRLEERVNRLTSRLTPLQEDLDEISTTIRKIQTWDIEKLLEIVRNIDGCLNSGNGTSKILKFLVREYAPGENNPETSPDPSEG